jgi:hypothetical protein
MLIIIHWVMPKTLSLPLAEANLLRRRINARREATKNAADIFIRRF